MDLFPIPILYSQLREIVTAYRINPLQHLLDLGFSFYTPNNNC